MAKNNETVKETEEKAVEKTETKEEKGKKEKAVEKTYTVRVPVDPLNPTDKEIIVGINEKYAKVIRGEETEVSEPVYEQLKNAGLI